MSDATPSTTDPVPNKKDADGNEISPAGKLIALVLLVGLTTFSLVYLIGHWPDQLPDPKKAEPKPLYTYEWFNVSLIDCVDTGKKRPCCEFSTPLNDTAKVNTDSTTNAADSVTTDSAGKPTLPPATAQTDTAARPPVIIKDLRKGALHINSILLILVAVGGFLGNMIYLSTSFTTFIGVGKYKKSWTLWYIVKPVTASALALGVYFVFRGGFLNSSDASANINLYGLMTLSILAGLFTDRTTLKLKELFDVLIRPKDDRTGKAGTGDADKAFKPEKISYNELSSTTAQKITITGKNLDRKGIKVLVDDNPVENLKVTATSIIFDFKIPDDQATKETFKLKITGETGDPYEVDLKQKGSE